MILFRTVWTRHVDHCGPVWTAWAGLNHPERPGEGIGKGEQGSGRRHERWGIRRRSWVRPVAWMEDRFCRRRRQQRVTVVALCAVSVQRRRKGNGVVMRAW